MPQALSRIVITCSTWIILLASSAVFADTNTLRLYTTTSTRDSGLMATLVPAFEKQTGIYVDLQATGTGKAIRSARLGKVDLLWVHAPASENSFIDAGFATQRIETMYNDFILVGPAQDPAGVKTAKTVTEALQKIYQHKQTFVSRADDSGTNKRELSIWNMAGIRPFGIWYFETGAGMKKTVLKASDLGAYSITDRGTWLANKHLFKLEIVFEGGPELLNIYSMLPINPAKFPGINTISARKFIDFVTKGDGLDIIKQYKINGELLFKVKGNQ